MNKYLNKLIMYHEVNKMKREGHSISRIAEFLGMNWRTVKKMLSMNDNEYEQYLTSQFWVALPKLREFTYRVAIRQFFKNTEFLANKNT
jgi:hypothetical protein